MRLIASGIVFDTRAAPVNERSASATSALLTADGTLLATMRLGSDREGPDGHTAILASTDRGDTWRIRYLGLGDRDWDGITGETRPLHIRLAREHGLAAPSGVGVVQVAPGSPAELAGLQPRDVILWLDDTRVNTVDDVHRFLSRAPIGAPVRLGLLRRSQRHELAATLAALPEEG